MDKISKEQRSYNMSQISSKNTSPEIIVRKYLYSLGYRYRIHDKNLPGKPDIVFKKLNKLINVNGCFWHLHSCKNGSYIPKSNTKFWIQKLNRNKLRDTENYKKLWSDGWDILTLWECDIKSGNFKKNLETDQEVIQNISKEDLDNCFRADIHQQNLNIIWERLGI